MNTTSIKFKRGENPDLCIICFGGLCKKYYDNPDKVELPFEWSGECQNTEYSYILVRDLQQCWYQQGLIGYESIEASVCYLQGIIDILQPKILNTTGCSAGGYAALLFGYLLKANTVHSFCPQTWLDYGPRHGFIDRKYEERIDYLVENKINTGYKDLKLVLKDNGITKYNVYCCENHRDYYHLRNIADTPNLIKHIYDCDRHDVNNYIRAQNISLIDLVTNL